MGKLFLDISLKSVRSRSANSQKSASSFLIWIIEYVSGFVVKLTGSKSCFGERPEIGHMVLNTPLSLITVW